jgi:hypothetical protein
MSQLVKTKYQVNFKDFKRFGAFKGLVEQKNVVFNSFLCKMLKKIYWETYLLIWRSLKVALNRSIILKYMYEIVIIATYL